MPATKEASSETKYLENIFNFYRIMQELFKLFRVENNDFCYLLVQLAVVKMT